MKQLLTVLSGTQQAKRNKPQRFKQLPTGWWRVLQACLKKLRRAARKSSTSCQTAVNHSPHQSAPIKSLNQKINPKQQLWQRLKGPSTDSNSTLGSNITSSFSQPLVNFSPRLSPAAPADPHSFAHRGLSALSINHPSLKVSGISQIISQLIDMNSLLKYASLKPLPLIIHTSTSTLSILPLPESQRHQKKAALVYLPKQINYLPPLPPIMVVNKPPQPLDADGQWLANKLQVIDPAVKITNPSLEGSTVKETEPKKSTQKKLQNKSFEKALSFHILEKKSQELSTFQKSKKRCNSYSVSELEQPPRKRAKLEYNPYLDEAETPLNEPENDIVYPSLEKFSVTEKEPEKGTSKKTPKTVIKEAKYPRLWNISYRSIRKHHNPYSLLTLEEPPNKRAGLESNSTLGEAETLLIDPAVEMINPSPEESTVKETEPEKPTPQESQNTTFKRRLFFCQKFPTSQKSRKRCHPDSDLELTETPKNPATLASISNPNGIETPLIKPEYTFWLYFEEKRLLCGARYYPKLAEFLQIDPLTYQHPYLEQSINAYTTPSESLLSLTKVDSCSSDSTFKNINLTNSLLIGQS